MGEAAFWRPPVRVKLASGFRQSAIGSGNRRPIVPATVSAMPGLFGYMVAIVVTLGAYLAGLHWLVSPPDPWRSNPKIVQMAQQSARKHVSPVAPPAPARATPAVSTEPDIRLASVQTSASVQAGESLRMPPTEPNTREMGRPIVGPAHITRREISPAKRGSGNRKRAERNTSRRLQLMVLRTYERSDGNVSPACCH